MAEYELGKIRTDRGEFVDKGNYGVDPCHDDFSDQRDVGDGLIDARDAVVRAAAFISEKVPGAPLILRPNKIFRIGSSITLPTAVVSHGGKVKPVSGATISFSGAIEQGPQQWLDTSEGGSFDFINARVRAFYPEWFGASGNGDDDDSTALRETFTAADSSGGGQVVLTKGTYNLSTWSEYRNSAPLTVVAEKPGTATLVGPGSGTFLAPDSELHFYGVAVKEFTTHVLLDSDENIDYLHVEKCQFTDFTRAIYGPSATTGGVKNVVITGSYFSSGLASAVEMQHSALESALVTNNIIDGITRNGYVRGIMLGQNATLPETGLRGRYIVANNIILNLISTGAFEVQAILLYGERAIVESNQIETVESEADTGCEGIYTKCRYTSVSDNVLLDAGQYQSAINIKGARRSEGDEAVAPGYVVNCSDNIVIFSGKTRPGGTHGITVETDEAKLDGNQIHGCIGNPIHVRYPLNTVVSRSIITRCNATVMIRVEPYSELSVGDTVIIEDNLIADITRTSGNIWGIAITNSSPGVLKNVFVRRNTMRRFTTPGSVWGIVIQVSEEDIEGLWIEDNVVPAEAARGLNLTGANSIYGLVLRNNDLRCAGDPVTLFATMGDDPIIAGNLGVATKRKMQVTIAAAATQSANTAYGTPSYARAVQGADVMVGPVSDLGNATKWWFIPSTSNFRVFVDQAPGATVTFNAWVDIETPAIA